MTVDVRALLAADEPRWRELWAAYLAFYGQQLPDAVTDHTWRRVVGGLDGYRGHAAVRDGTVVGLAHSVPRTSTWSREPDLHLEDLFVAPDARGSGAGAALLAAVTDRARQLRARKLTWETGADNEVAQRLYDRVAARTTEVHYELDPAVR